MLICETKAIFCSPMVAVVFAQHTQHREVGTMARVDLRRISFTILSSSRTVEGGKLQLVHVRA